MHHIHSPNKRAFASTHLCMLFLHIFSFLSPHQFITSLMEASQPLSIESFSYRWLININPALEILDDDETASFIEMDPKLPPSKRFLGDAIDFSFDFPTTKSALTLVHADELISNGLLVPLFVNTLKMKEFDTTDSISRRPISSQAPKMVVSANCSSVRRCRRTLSKRVIQKYMHFLRQFYQRMRSWRSSSKGENVYFSSPEASPRTSAAYSESSIYEAVLHCKRSNGM